MTFQKRKPKFVKKNFNKKPVLKKPQEEITLKKSMLTNSAVVTVRNPSKKVETLCKQLRKILSPDCLSKLEINPKMQDVVDVSDQLLVKQIVYLSENELRIGVVPTGPTFDFKLVEYENNFKSFSNDIYKQAPFITFEGKSFIKPIFLSLGANNNPAFKRVLHFHLKDDLIYVRHFIKSTEDTDDNFKVHMKEIGPRITLKYIQSTDGIFSDMKLKTRFKNRFSKEDE